MSAERVQNLVIGAGISGLCAALALGGDTLILEREPEPGGYCRSIEKDGFLWDYAGHFFHFRTEAGRRFFLSLFSPDELVEAERRSRILYRGRQIDAPFQANLAQLPQGEQRECLRALFRRPKQAAYANFLDYLYGSFGAAITDKFLRPYNEKLYACPLDTLDAGAMGRFFPAMTPHQIVRSLRSRPEAAYNARFYYPKGGAGALIERLAARLPSGSLLTGRALRSLDAQAHLAVDDLGRRYRYDRLVSTAPLKRFLSLLGSREAAEAADSLSANKVLVLNFGFERPAPALDCHWLYVPGPEARFYRLGCYDRVLGQGRASLYLELAFPAGAAVDIPREREAALSALYALGLIGPENRLLSHGEVLMDPAYVHLRPGTRRQTDAIRAALAGMDVLSLGRYGGWRYCSMEDCMLEALALREGALP